MADNTAPKQLEPYEFKKGESGNPKGRPKGSRNKLSESFIYALYEDFMRYGAYPIARTRRDDPAAYLRVIASVVPKEFTGNINHSSEIDNLTDGELRERISDTQKLVDSIQAAIIRLEGVGEEEDSTQTLQ